jgi:hypothetical protein
MTRAGHAMPQKLLLRQWPLHAKHHITAKSNTETKVADTNQASIDSAFPVIGHSIGYYSPREIPRAFIVASPTVLQ